MKNIIALLLLFCSVAYGQTGNTDYQYALIEAVKQKNLGNIPGAIELYQMVIQENDSVAVAHYELGTLLAMTGDIDKSVKELEYAYILDVENDWYFNSYVDVLTIREEYKQAIKIIKIKQTKKPEDVEYSFKLANIYYLSGKTKKSIRTLNNIEEEYGISDKVILLKATIFEKKKDYEKALVEVDKIIALFPESVDYHVVAAELAMQSKDSDRAVDYYLEVMQLDSSNIYAITNLTDYYRDRGELDRSFYYLNKSFESSEIEYNKKMAILSYYLSDEKLFNDHASTLEVLIRTMLDKYPKKREIHLFSTDFYIQYRKYNEALSSLQPILIKGEKQYELWRQGVLLANATNQSEIMLELATSGGDIFPDSLELFYYKGLAEYGLDRNEEAIKTFTSKIMNAIRQVELASQIKGILADSYYRVENYQKSDSLYRSIINEEPTNFIAMNNFAYYLSLRNESLEEAKMYSYNTIEKDPKNSVYLDTYAWILFKMEDFKGAEKYIMEALKFGGEKDADVNEHAAEIHRAIGSISLARAYYQKALLLGGNKETILKSLQDIAGQND